MLKCYLFKAGKELGEAYEYLGFKLPSYSEYDVRVEVTISVNKYDRECYINEIYVAENLRGHGLGTELLSELIKLAREYRCKTIRLDRANDRLLDWYERHGFKCRRSSKNTPYKNMVLKLRE